MRAHLAAHPEEPSAPWLRLALACCHYADGDLALARALLAAVHPTDGATQHHHPLIHGWLTALLAEPPRPGDVPADEPLARALLALHDSSGSGG